MRKTKLHLVYGYDDGIMFITKSPSPVAFSLRKLIKGQYNIKAKRTWAKRMNSLE
jgi:hypothetical protein